MKTAINTATQKTLLTGEVVIVEWEAVEGPDGEIFTHREVQYFEDGYVRHCGYRGPSGWVDSWGE
jgi:hypothetical protein